MAPAEDLRGPDIAAPGGEPGIAARWVPVRERDELEVAEEDLSRYAAEVEDAWRRERQATAYEQIARRANDPKLLGLARDAADTARDDRQAATRGAYAATARLQRSALGLGPDDAGICPQPRGSAGEAAPRLARPREATRGQRAWPREAGPIRSAAYLSQNTQR
jgi:hypothetical protein